MVCVLRSEIAQVNGMNGMGGESTRILFTQYFIYIGLTGPEIRSVLQVRSMACNIYRVLV